MAFILEDDDTTGRTLLGLSGEDNTIVAFGGAGKDTLSGDTEINIQTGEMVTNRKAEQDTFLFDTAPGDFLRDFIIYSDKKGLRRSGPRRARPGPIDHSVTIAVDIRMNGLAASGHPLVAQLRLRCET